VHACLRGWLCVLTRACVWVACVRALVCCCLHVLGCVRACVRISACVCVPRVCACVRACVLTMHRHAKVLTARRHITVAQLNTQQPNILYTRCMTCCTALRLVAAASFHLLACFVGAFLYNRHMATRASRVCGSHRQQSAHKTYCCCCCCCCLLCLIACRCALVH
jgi:hypothetical protein